MQIWLLSNKSPQDLVGLQEDEEDERKKAFFSRLSQNAHKSLLLSRVISAFCMSD
jgi:hypothetical protein